MDTGPRCTLEAVAIAMAAKGKLGELAPITENGTVRLNRRKQPKVPSQTSPPANAGVFLNPELRANTDCDQIDL
jgi:hypothetical protein